MTYNVFSGTLNLTQSACVHRLQKLRLTNTKVTDVGVLFLEGTRSLVMITCIHYDQSLTTYWLLPIPVVAGSGCHPCS